MAYPRPGAWLMLQQLLLPAAYLRLIMVLHAADALSFSYNFSNPGDLQAAELTYMNDSSISGDRVNLTANTIRSTGRVAYPRPVRLWDDRTGRTASFTTNFSFFIGNGNSGNGNDRGDGMAFFIGPFPATLPGDSDGGFLGLFSNNTDDPSATALTGVGVEFDTYKNHGLDPPNVTADHIGIDVGSITSASYTALPNLTLSGVMSASIRYDGGSKMLSVSLWLADGGLYTVEARVDLKDAVAGPDAAVGFSAATGNLVETHQLLSWSFSSTDPSKNEPWVTISIAVASASLVGLVAALLCSIMPRQPPTPPIEKIELPVAREFPYSDLSAATKNFSQDRLLGAGAFGEVYRGELLLEEKMSFAKRLRDPHKKRPVAVKKLTTVIQQTRKDYVSEITTLGQLSHRNLVKLVGWCDGGGSDKPLLLVYELVTNKSLDDHLHGWSSERVLTWPERYKIVLGVGAAIEYLHTGGENPILHRDIKPSNVMLDDAYEAKLGDFGFVRHVGPGEGSLRGTAMVGSWDYMDPLCITTGSATTASDMYSFGMLLLEIATGTRPRVMRPAGEDAAAGLIPNTLVNAVRASYGEGSAVAEIADAKLRGDYDEAQMERVLDVGLWCVQPGRRDRPGIRQGVYMLSNLRNPSPRVRFRIQGPRQQCYYVLLENANPE